MYKVNVSLKDKKLGKTQVIFLALKNQIEVTYLVPWGIYTIAWNHHNIGVEPENIRIF